MPKIPYCKDYPIFQWRQQCTQITITNLYLLIEMMHAILDIQCRGIDIWVREIQSYVWKWQFEKLLTKTFGCPEGSFFRVWVSKWHPDTLLAKIMTQIHLPLTHHLLCLRILPINWSQDMNVCSWECVDQRACCLQLLYNLTIYSRCQLRYTTCTPLTHHLLWLRISPSNRTLVVSVCSCECGG